MTSTQNQSNFKRNFWLGVVSILLGIVCLAPLIYRSADSFKDRNVVGPFFGICVGLTFLIVGILRISKSRKPNEISSDCVKEQFSIGHSDDIKPNKRKTPILIKLVAWSPVIPLCIALIASAGCDFFSLRTCREHYSFMENMGYFGGLGWLVSLPVAGMLKLIHSAALSD